jgi:hypothetical protein
MLQLAAEGVPRKQAREESAVFLTKRAFCDNLCISMGENECLKLVTVLFTLRRGLVL